ncbi:MAG TPA: glycogen debranching protein GlgX [Acidimicrobiales bacterium]|nr:glycogen debranching protein GlgX [Acidimicrobiales bacterium]
MPPGFAFGSQMEAGKPYPLGATFDGTGTNFSIFSEVADRVELCLYDQQGRETRFLLPEELAHVHHGYLRGVMAGQRYGYRILGPWRPSEGLRCNPEKLLLDPYGKAVDGNVRWNRSVFAHQARDDTRSSRSDSAASMPKNVVISPYFDWGNDRPPAIPWHRTVVYELHVKGFTALHPAVPPALRGTYAGLATPAVIDHLLSLGITAVELQPVHQFVHDYALVNRGLRNYWGYNSIAYLAPHHEYAADKTLGHQVQEFKYMVKALHAAGIEVLLDVVYNHTAEGNHLGPSLSLKGIDNPAYYRLNPDEPRYYVDYTGTGNTLNVRHPHVLQLLMDSLRYWVQDMHVDGFRFDLAATLARTLHDVDRLSAFFDIIQQDPVISQVKLIAEPWDVGEGGYQVGNFPPLWSEWNGRYRDCVRDYWRGQDQTLPELAYRLTGSSDLYEHTGRKPWASINFVTCHDGFTLSDLVSYNEKHNEANGEDNRDGDEANRSWNCGVEGPTDDPEILKLRHRQARNLLATLFLSQGVPMLLAGDELGRTQGGNNNAYCQDNLTSWVDWTTADEDLLEFARKLTAVRRDHAVFHRPRWYQGRALHGEGVSDIVWFAPDGNEMSEADWHVAFAKSLGVLLNGADMSSTGSATGTAGTGGSSPASQVRTGNAEKPSDDSFYIVLNAFWERIQVSLPSDQYGGGGFEYVFDTGQDHPFDVGRFQLRPGAAIPVEGRSVVVLRQLPCPA